MAVPSREVSIHKACRLLLASLFAAPMAALAFPTFETRLTAVVIDETSRQPLPTVYFVADEHHRMSGLGHGSVHRCIRSAAAIGRGGRAELTLPKAEMRPIERISGERHTRSFAYSPGYCTLPTWTEKSGESTFKARRNTDPPEQRIRYIASVLFGQVLDRCATEESRDSTGVRAAMVAELLEEAKTVAGTPYERFLAARLAAAASGSRSAVRLPATRGFAIVDTARPALSINWNTVNTTCKDCSRIEAPVVSITQAPPASPVLGVVCRVAGECDLDRRNERGTTYLAELIEAADAAKVAMMLAAGADPNVERHPGGPTGLDLLLGEAGQWYGARLAAAIDTLKVLAADGRATVRPGSRPSWEARATSNSQAGEIAMQLGRLPARAAYVAACTFDGSSSALWDPGTR